MINLTINIQLSLQYGEPFDLIIFIYSMEGYDYDYFVMSEFLIGKYDLNLIKDT